MKITLQRNTWIELYSTAGITPGTALYLKSLNKGNVRGVVSETAPVTGLTDTIGIRHLKTGYLAAGVPMFWLYAYSDNMNIEITTYEVAPDYAILQNADKVQEGVTSEDKLDTPRTKLLVDSNGNQARATWENGRWKHRYTPRSTVVVPWMPICKGTVNGSSSFTNALTIAAPCASYDAVAAVFCNRNSADYTVGCVSIAPSESLANGNFIPTIGGVAKNVLAGATDYAGFTKMTAGGNNSFVVPANTDFFITDPLPIESLPRTDGGARALIMARAEVSSQATTTFYFSSSAEAAKFSAADAKDGGCVYPGITWGTATGASNPPTTAAMSASTMMLIRGFIFYSRNKVVGSVLHGGDSIDAGVGRNGDNSSDSALNVTSSLNVACSALSTPTAPIGLFSVAIPGNSGLTPNPGGTLSIFTRMKAAAAAIKPTIAIFPVYTPNDSVGDAVGRRQAIQRALDFIEYCHQNRIIPVARLPVPYGVSNDVARMKIINEIKASGTLILDANTPLYDPAGVTSKWKNGYTVDSTHPAAIGHSAVDAKAIDLLKFLFGMA